jgi:hypothetical protein
MTYKLFLESKKIIKVILSSITETRLIVYIENPKEAFSVDYIYIKKDTEVEKTTIVNIITISHFVRCNIIFIINLNASQANI